MIYLDGISLAGDDDSLGPAIVVDVSNGEVARPAVDEDGLSVFVEDRSILEELARVVLQRRGGRKRLRVKSRGSLDNADR